MLWFAVALAMLLTAAVLRPDRIAPPLGEDGEELTNIVVQGLPLVRGALLAGACLACLSALLWRFDSKMYPRSPHIGLRFSRLETLWLACVLLIFIGVSASNLASSLWWDELGSLIRVKRGLPTVLMNSANANNHIFNSVCMWITIHTIGEGEFQFRLAPLLFGAGTICAVYWALRSQGLLISVIGSAIVATHFTFINHATEARGYAGAMFFGAMGCLLFARLLREGGVWPTLWYVACSFCACGFIITTILIPIAHGALACAWWLKSAIKHDATTEKRARSAVFACLWVGVLSAICFGILVPQIVEFARTRAANHHKLLSLALVEQVLAYFTNGEMLGVVPLVAVSLAVVGLCIFGWWKLRDEPAVLAAWLVPGAMALVWLLLGNRASARFFCFLIPPFAIGLAVGAVTLACSGKIARVGLALVVAAYLCSDGSMLWRLRTLGRPDLKSLGARLNLRHVLVMGQQARSNEYYFPTARIVYPMPEDDALPEGISEFEYIVEGCVRVEKPNPKLLAMGYVVEERLESAVPDHTHYFVYHRALAD